MTTQTSAFPGPEFWSNTYRPVQCLKRNEQGETWLLEDRHSLTRYILKKAVSGQSTRLQEEAGLLKKLAEHPEFPVPRYIDFRNDEHFSYLLREYIPGRTLADLTDQEGPLSCKEVLELARKLCVHIRLFHHQEPPVIHRDIKPENIVITDTGRVRLIDFDTARSYKPNQENDTIAMGTKGYAAPEQFGFGQTDERTDIYAIGKVILYMLTGACDDEAFHTLKEQFPKRLISRCCAYDPSDRYQNTDQLLKALQRWQKYSSRSFRQFYFMTGALTLMGLALICLAFQNHQLRRQLPISLEENADAYTSAWNPYLFEDSVKTILQFYRENKSSELAAECEALIMRLYENDTIQQVEPVAYWEMSEEELHTYQTKRMGYEYIADRLAYSDFLAVERLGSYEDYAEQIVLAIRTCMDYSWTDENGNQVRSVLCTFAQGDNRNMDGCLIDLISCLHQAFQKI